MTEIHIYSFPREQAKEPREDRDWTRYAVWCDGEWIDGGEILYPMDSEDEVFHHFDGPTMWAMYAEDVPEYVEDYDE